MRPQLDRGRLIPPNSIQEAQARLQALEHEITSIDRQLEDDERQIRYGTNYMDWVRRANAALNLFLSERRQLKEWLITVEHPDFRAAYDLLQTLRKEDVDFEPCELELIARLDKLFN